MASGLLALLDDVAALSKLAAASLDDITAASGKAGAKAAGIVIDDTAVTPRYVVGLAPERELPIIWKIARGSLKNKPLFILPAALLLSAFAPWAITPLLMAGGAFLCFEAAEKVLEALGYGHAKHDDDGLPDDPAELERVRVNSAVRTDLILSAEIMAISLAQIPEQPLVMQGIILLAVALIMTALVYGLVAVIVKLDDIGFAMSRRKLSLTRAVGRMLVTGVPKFLSVLAVIGTAAMAWVGGGIIVHGLAHYGIPPLPTWEHAAIDWAKASAPFWKGFFGWFGGAFVCGLVGLAIGGVIAGGLKLVPHKA
jgi:uncharacterized protein